MLESSNVTAGLEREQGKSEPVDAILYRGAQEESVGDREIISRFSLVSLSARLAQSGFEAWELVKGPAHEEETARDALHS